MTLAIVAAIGFIAHVAIWVGLPSNPPESAPLDGVVLEAQAG